MRLAVPIFRVLLVDDEPVVLRGLKRGMATKRPHWNIVSAEGPIEGMCRLEADTYDIVISDYEMPQLNGVEIMKLARRHQPTALRVILSGISRQTVGPIPPGLIHGWLSKLHDVDILVTRCEELLAKRLQRKARVKAG
jgi:DNA-binding NarL/FixJ family response regulator